HGAPAPWMGGGGGGFRPGAVGGASRRQGDEESGQGYRERKEDGRDELRLVPRGLRQGRRTRGSGAAAPEAGQLDVASDPKGDRRRALLENLEWSRRDATVEAPPGAGARGGRKLHPDPEGNVAASTPQLERPAGASGGAFSR